MIGTLHRQLRAWFGEWQPYIRPRIIELAEGADENGFAIMIQGLLSQNAEDHQAKARALASLQKRIAIVVEDAGVSITLNFEKPTVVVHDGIVGIPDLTIRASSEWITQMSLVELVPRIGIPDPRGEVAAQISKAQKAGEIKMYGALAHPRTVLRLTEVLSVNE